MSTTRSPASDPETAGQTWGPVARIGVSLLLVGHLIAIVLGPLSMPPALLADYLNGWFRPYTQAVFMGHAYKFFAPDPGPTHLIRYDLEMPDGKHRTGEFPSLDEHWPRLRYHRHFMLTEFLGGAPPAPGWELQPWDKQPPGAWQPAYARSFATHLLDTYGGRRVTLQLVRHSMPYPDQILSGVSLRHPESFQTRLLGSFEGELR